MQKYKNFLYVFYIVFCAKNTDFEKFLEYVQLNENNFESLRALSELDNTEVKLFFRKKREK